VKRILAERVVCYYGSWSSYYPEDGRFEVEDIDPNLCTHAIYAFVGLDWNEGVRILDSWSEINKGKYKMTNVQIKHANMCTWYNHLNTVNLGYISLGYNRSFSTPRPFPYTLSLLTTLVTLVSYISDLWSHWISPTFPNS
jgi:hypothetical protein